MSPPVIVVLLLIIFLPIIGLLAALVYAGGLFLREAVRNVRLRRP
ncbi:hypothetical protein [Acidithiobacillus thiooxidans]|nr:hypothetical protein [Acidithiobacillus thiooxidans]